MPSTKPPEVPEYLANYCALHGLTVTYCANNNEGIASATWYITNRAGHHVMNRWVSRTQEDMLQLLEEVRGHGYFQK